MVFLLMTTAILFVFKSIRFRINKEINTLTVGDDGPQQVEDEVEEDVVVVVVVDVLVQEDVPNECEWLFSFMVVGPTPTTSISSSSSSSATDEGAVKFVFPAPVIVDVPVAVAALGGV